MLSKNEASRAMRCRYCGNENPEGHRFCGLCGKSLADVGWDAPKEPLKEVPREFPREKAVPSTPAWRSDLDVEPVETRTPKPMLLSEPERPQDVSYLLEEEEEDKPKNSVTRILILLVGLALIGGFGYTYLLSGDGFSVLKSKLGAGSASPNAATAAQPAPANAAPVTPAPSTLPAKTQPAVPAPEPVDTVKPANTTAASPSTSAASEDETEADKPAPQRAAKAPVVKPITKPSAAAAKPVTALPPTKPVPTPKSTGDLVSAAEKLIYGDGVPQDCDHGLGAMRPLAQAADPKAMVALGVLYTTGTCVPRDLPTAYSWYAKALHKTPDNLTLQQDMKQIWGQMTPPERQLAIRLSQ